VRPMRAVRVVCPAKGAGSRGQTDINKCLRVCRPLGVGAVIGYFSKMVGKPPEEQIKMLRDPYLWNLYQALEYGTYACFKCVAVCPVGSSYPTHFSTASASPSCSTSR